MGTGSGQRKSKETNNRETCSIETSTIQKNSRETMMNDEDRDKLIVEMHTDIKWIKDWVKDQGKYKLMVWGALIAAVISLVAK